MTDTKFDLKAEVTRPLYASVGATDRAVGAVRGSIAEWQSRFADVQKDVQTRISGIQGSVTHLDWEARVADLQGRIRTLLKDGEAAYDDLVTRGETLVERIRRQETTQEATVEEAAPQASTTPTRAAKPSSARTRSGTAQQPAKAAGTRAKRTTRTSAKAVAEGAEQVGD